MVLTGFPLKLQALKKLQKAANNLPLGKNLGSIEQVVK